MQSGRIFKGMMFYSVPTSQCMYTIVSMLRRFGHYLRPSGSAYTVTLNSLSYSHSTGQCSELGDAHIAFYNVRFQL
jgi:hypothetical protein